MLDLKSKIVLKILQKECPNGAYKIIEAKDIISSMPARYRVDFDGLDNILIYLERQEYISIKYDDDGVYCLCLLPFGNEVLESDNDKKRSEVGTPHLWLLIIIIFCCCLVSSSLSLLLAYILILH